MKPLFIATLAIASTVCIAGTVTLKVSGTSGLKGTAKVINEMMPDGSKSSRMEMVLRDAKGQAVSIVQSSVYDPSGVPKSKQQTTTIQGKSEHVVTAIFETGIVVLKASANGKTTQTTVPIPSGITVAEKFEFWFCRDRIPLKGQNTFLRFDLVTLSFEKTKSVYQGVRTVRVGGRKVKAHLVEVDDAKIYLDDKGDPYKIVSPGVVMDRIR